MKHPRSFRISRPLGLAIAALIAVPAAAVLAHDFWIVPVTFEVAPGATAEILGQTGTRFPVSQSAVAPERVAEARVITRDQDEKVTDISTREKSLVLRHRPAKAGQAMVAVTLVPASRRVAVAGLKRYIGLEGAPELAQRYEQEGRYPQGDSVTQRSQKFAKAIMEIGRNGPRLDANPVGHLLELVPLSDPVAMHAGQTFEVMALYRGKPLPKAYLHAGPAATDTATTNGARATADTTLVTDDGGVARLPIRGAGLWNVRLLHAAPVPNAADEWEVLFATLVFTTGKHVH